MQAVLTQRAAAGPCQLCLVLLHHGRICLLPCLNNPQLTPLPELKEISSATSLTPTEYSRSFLQIFPILKVFVWEFWNSKIHICLLRFLQLMQPHVNSSQRSQPCSTVGRSVQERVCRFRMSPPWICCWERSPRNAHALITPWVWVGSAGTGGRVLRFCLRGFPALSSISWPSPAFL